MLLYLRELFSQVVSALLRNKLRSFLTMAGIAWGVASIVLIVAMGDGFKAGQRDRFRQLGENIVILFPGRTEKQAGGLRAGRRIRAELRRPARHTDRVFPGAQHRRRIAEPARTTSRYNGGTFSVMGVEPPITTIRTIPIDRGRFLVPQDEEDAARVAVIGDNVRKVLFGEHPVAPGDTFSINGLPFRIVGLMPPKDQNSSYNGLDSDKIFVPYSTMVRDLPPDDTNFHPGIVSDMIYVPADLEELEAGTRPGDPRAGSQSSVRPRGPERGPLLGHGGKRRTGGQHVHFHDGFSGRHCGSHSDSGWSRRDEHHAGLGDRTHA